MTNDKPEITIEFDAEAQRFLALVFVEVFGGGSTAAIQTILGDSVEAARELEPIVKAQWKSDSGYLELTQSQWRIMYESLNAVIYGLGPTELQTCTGTYLHQAANINLKICSAVWGAFFGRYRWNDVKVKKIE